VEDQPYRNVFADVHSKIKALKERIAAANKDDRELRESKAAEESKTPRLRRQLASITCVLPLIICRQTRYNLELISPDATAR